MTIDKRAFAVLLGNQRGVLSRAQVLTCGVTAHGLRHRARPGGPWQRLLPAVYLTTTGEPTRAQLQIAAMLYAGPQAMITGPSALHIYGIRAAQQASVDVLVPVNRRLASCGCVVIHRTRRMPLTAACDGILRFAPEARAVADAVRGISRLSDVRAVVASAVQKRCCTVEQLAAELSEGPIRGSARLRSVLAEVAAGARSAAECDFRDLIMHSGLPAPLFNPQLTLNGKRLAIPDAWWPHAGVAAEVDSREWHLSPEDWEHTMRRHDGLAAAGIIVLHFSPRQIRTEPDRIVQDIGSALRAGRPVPDVVTLPSAA